MRGRPRGLEDLVVLVALLREASYQSSIQMAPYEALYGRRCISPVGWSELGEARILGANLVQDALDKVKYVGDLSHVLDFSTVQLDDYLTYDVELVAILERQVQKLRSKDIASVKVQ
ncbi:uncharacterized protein [Nicotiana sylvestris]|uniref:uncharacterized protein n=1 Tax=Nicotiana sylvestris TaxID=4096 RepID=UPI00388C4A1B